MSGEKIVVLEGARTPIGSFGGMFKDVPGLELGAVAVREALKRAEVEDGDVSEVVVGCIGQVGPDAYDARRVAVKAGARDRGSHRAELGVRGTFRRLLQRGGR